MTNSDRLTQLELNFCHEYLKDGHGTNAYLRANTRGVSRETANTESSQLLAKTRVQEHLEKLRSEMAFRTEVTIDKIIHESAIIAFSDINDVVEISELVELNEDGSIAKATNSIKIKEDIPPHISAFE